MWRDFLYFRKSDRRVIVVLAFAAVFCVGLMIGRKGHLLRPGSPDVAGVATDSSRAASRPGGDGPAATAALHAFDPNTVDSATLVGFGVAPWKVRNFVRYRRAGKVFRTPDDMLKTYGWSEEDIAPLRPHIAVAPAYRQRRPRTPDVTRPASVRDGGAGLSERASAASFPKSNKFQTLTRVDPNTADTALLQRIPGIGAHFSRSIVRYRERLGGLHDTRQLLEINNFPAQTLEWFRIERVDIRKTNINTATLQQLGSHPYIGYERARRLKELIHYYGDFEDIDKLGAAYVFSNEEIEKLRPYLDFTTKRTKRPDDAGAAEQPNQWSPAP